MAPGEWRFFYNLKKKMSQDDLVKYQKKLVELRDKYSDKVSQISNCRFHQNQAPPLDNIFAEFDIECKRHSPKCVGWFLLWNPNSLINETKLHSSLHNHCATWQFKSVSKMIQKELIETFGDYFEMYDDDDTHPYSSEISYEFSYGFKRQDEEFPDYVTGNLVEK